MIKRVLVIILIIPAIVAMGIIQLPYGIIKYIISGEGLTSDPWPDKLLDWAKSNK